jgi:hypothetical protein
MKIMTFEEWCEANQDLVDEAHDEAHPSGMSWGKLVNIEPIVGDLGAFKHIEGRLRSLYDAQLTRDAEKLAAWNAACAGSASA